MAGFRLEAEELGIPLHRHAPVTKLVAHDPFVVILTEDENERIRSHALPRFAEGDTRHPSAFSPDVCARPALAELERPIDDAELRVDLQGARLHAESPGLQRRAGVPVDDQRAHASPTELIG